MQNDLRRGAFFATLAALTFTLSGLCIKAAAEGGVANEVVVFVRSAVSLAVLLPWILYQGAGRLLRTQRLGGHLWRAGFGVASMYMFFYGIAHLHLAAAMLFTYSMPLFVPFIAWAWIHEKPAPIVFPAAAMGLLGIALIVKPGTEGLDPWASFIGISSGVLAACAMVSIRRVSDTEPTARIVFYFAALATLISAVPMFWFWQNPNPANWLLLIGAGVTATLGQLCLTQAYVCAPAARVGPFTYLTVIFSAVAAWLLWGEHLDLWFALGTALVIGTCILVTWRRPEPLLEE